MARKWVLVKDRLPEELVPVNITWVKNDPPAYYSHIKGKKLLASGIYSDGSWYWYSVTCADLLAEYGNNEPDRIDYAIDVIAWQPLPLPA